MRLRILSLAILVACDAPSGPEEKPGDDADGDGYAAGFDCDDEDSNITPFADEICDGVDNNCDGDVDTNAIDATPWYLDGDGDGYGNLATYTVTCTAPDNAVADSSDCNDSDSAISPGASELCDGVDNNCDGEIDNGAEGQSTFYLDQDGDGYGDPDTAVLACAPGDGEIAIGGDCNDADTAYHPDAPEEDCSDPNDYNCDGSVAFQDADGDGSAACVDCDDSDPLRSPTAPEICDTVDNDCDGEINNNPTDPFSFFPDGDGDGWAGDGTAVLACEATAGYAAQTGDCDDGNSQINPGASEVCDASGTDEDCDGLVDDADPSLSASSASTWYADADGDRYGDAAVALVQCLAPSGYVSDSSDCNDSSAAISPGATEICNAAATDEDCNGLQEDADPGVTNTSPYYSDNDGDSYGNLYAGEACVAPSGNAGNADDCNDADAAISPAAAEVCDPSDVDEDCDGLTEDSDPSVTGQPDVYTDGDGDGFGDAVSRQSCASGAGESENSDDCDDSNAAINPSAQEQCDAANVDEDCDGLTDDQDPTAVGQSAWHYDVDGDGYAGTTLTILCEQPAGTYVDVTDCDDNDAARNPGVPEICDAANVDEDCDGLPDDLDSNVTGTGTSYRDADGDAYGDPKNTTASCDPVPGYIADSTDCDDSSPKINPAVPEICDAADADENCNGLADDADSTATGQTTWYLDVDGDNYGVTKTTKSACNRPSGYSPLSTDCDDTTATISPAVAEICGDGIDQDCTGADLTCPVDTSDTGGGGGGTITRFVALGDAGTGTITQSNVGKAIATVCAKDGCDFALYLGDNIYPSGVTSVTDAQFQSKFETPYASLNFPFMVVPGNHDYGGSWDPSRVQYQVDYTAYSGKWFMPDTYYTQVEGDITFFAFDTQALYMGYGASQVAWIPAELAAATTTWKIGFGHHPYLSNGPHGNAGNYDGVPGEGQDVKDFMDAYVCGQMDVYFCGHDHVMEWLKSTCGSTELIVSGTGGSSYGLVGTNPTYFDTNTPGFVWVEINGRTMTAIFYDQNGTSLFQQSFTK